MKKGLVAPLRGLPNLGILTVRGPLQTPFVAPLRNGAVYRARDKAHGHGHVRVRLPVEGIRKGIVEALVDLRLVAALRFDCDRGLRQHFVHPRHVGHKDFADGGRRMIILVQTHDVALEVTVFRQPQGGQNHSDTVGDETETPDGGDDSVTVLVVQRHLRVGEVAVKVPLLLLGQGETKVFPGFEDVVQVLDSGPEFQEEIVLGDRFLVGEGTEPDEFRLQAVECEAAEQAVLGIRDEIENLIRRAGEQRGQLGLLDEHTLAVLTSGERYVLVVKRLAEAVGILAVVGGEDVGEGVAFAFEHHPAATVVVEDLIDHRGGTVGRDVVHQHRRFLGDFKTGLVLGGLVFLHLFFVLLLLLVALLVEVIVDCLREVATERKTPLACGSTGGDEQEEVGVHSPPVVNAGNVREAG